MEFLAFGFGLKKSFSKIISRNRKMKENALFVRLWITGNWKHFLGNSKMIESKHKTVSDIKWIILRKI